MSTNSEKLGGKVALVTGGSRGIGAAIAKRLASDGAAVAITYSNAKQSAEEVVRSIESADGRALAIQADNVDASAVKRAVDETVKFFGGLDVLVSNAGIAIFKPLEELSLDEGGSWAMGFWGADLFFVALNFLYRTLGLMTFGPVKLKWISVTHPDPLKRRSQLAARLRAECPRTLSLTAAGQLASMSDAVFQRLWELATPQLIQAYQNGARPSPVWQNLVTHTFAPA